MSSGGVVVANQPGVFLVDEEGNLITRTDGTAIGSAEGILIMGKDGINARYFRVDANGDLVALPLPTGAATAALQTSGNAILTTIDADTSTLAAVDFATQTTLASILVDTGQIEALLATIDADTSTLAAVDFATQTTLAAFKTAFDARDLATQTTLAAADAKLATIDAVLDAIKDTAGIKKITDQLPAGTNEIGKVAQGTKAIATGAWPAALYDSTGDEKLGQKVMALSIPVTMASNQPAIPVSVGAAASEGAVTEFVTLTGLPAGSHNMVVDGTTPKTFTFPADATRDIVLTGVRLVFSAAFFGFDGNTFGKGGGALPNGVQMNIVANNGIFTATLANLVVNEDFFRLLQFSISQAGSTDVMAATLPFQGRVVLEGGTADKVQVVIRDDLSSGARGITYFTGTVYGVLEV